MDTSTIAPTQLGFVGIKFCREWLVSVYFFNPVHFNFLFFSNNMLYPKEDKENRQLVYAVNMNISFQ